MEKEIYIFGIRKVIPDCEETEEFRFLGDYIVSYGEGYLISSYGRVYSLYQNRFVNSYENYHGYIYVKLSSNRQIKNFFVHTLVARAFLPNPQGKPHVHHKDVDPKNNHVDNLMWVTPAEHGRIHREINESRKGAEVR